jgi:site-specific DNA-methyltransferase (adenine-specific)
MKMRPHWQSPDGTARLFEGDARDLDGIPDGSIQLIVTSPPYFNARQEYASWPTYGAYLADMARAWTECYRILCDGGRICINMPDGYGRPGSGGYKLIGDDMARALQAAGFELRGKIIWYKGGAVARNSTAWGSWRSATNPSLRDCYEVLILAHKGSARRPGPAVIDADTFLADTVSVWEVQPARSRWHPAPFPAEIPRRVIRLLSFPGDTVLDLFAGTAVTVWEAARAGRLGIGVDACAAYLDRAVDDWESRAATTPERNPKAPGVRVD